MNDYVRFYIQEWQPEHNQRLFDLAAEYYRRTEAYDLTVCTGPVARDGIMPANNAERVLINRHARVVRAEVELSAEMLGYSRQQLREAMRQYAESPAYLVAMQNLIQGAT